MIGDAVDRDQAGEVVVEAELPGLRLGRLIGEVELGSAGQDRVAPPDHHLLAVPVRDHHGVLGVRRDGGEVHARHRISGCRTAGRGRLRRPGITARREERGRTDGHRCTGRGLENASTRDRGADDVPEVVVVAGVPGIVAARVAALVAAGHVGAGRTSGILTGGHEQLQRNTHTGSSETWSRHGAGARRRAR